MDAGNVIRQSVKELTAADYAEQDRTTRDDFPAALNPRSGGARARSPARN